MNKIDFTTFTEMLTEFLKEKLGEEYSIFTKKVRKNNGIELTGLIAQKQQCNTSPAIYIDDLFRDGMEEKDIQEAADSLCQEYHMAEFEESLDLSCFTELEQARGRIVFKLINAEQNRELLKTVPHRLYLDLAIVYYFVVQEAPFFGKASILINLIHMKRWRIDEESLYQYALSNTPCILPWKLESMEQVVEELLPEGLSENQAFEFHEEGTEIPMYVLSNEPKLLGASCILYPGVMEECANRLGGSFYILPSSIHETILLPEAENTEPETLLDIVSEINSTQVAPDEVLSNAVYYFNFEKNMLLQTC